jgi:hypothetical protein
LVLLSLAINKEAVNVARRGSNPVTLLPWRLDRRDDCQSLIELRLNPFESLITEYVVVIGI